MVRSYNIASAGVGRRLPTKKTDPACARPAPFPINVQVYNQNQIDTCTSFISSFSSVVQGQGRTLLPSGTLPPGMHSAGRFCRREEGRTIIT